MRGADPTDDLNFSLPSFLACLPDDFVLAQGKEEEEKEARARIFFAIQQQPNFARALLFVVERRGEPPKGKRESS